MNRRDFLGGCLSGGLAMTPIAAALSACGSSGNWPEGMEPIKWDRDTCVRCKMVISDRRFAAEARGGAKNEALKFDDIGCLVFWLKDLGWDKDPGARLWVADLGSRGNEVTWLDARKAHYVTKTSPMGYNQGAVTQPQPGSLDFAAMREHVLAKGK